MKGLRPEYKQKSKSRFRVVGRTRFPAKTYSTTPSNLTVKALPSQSYYSITDAETEDGYWIYYYEGINYYWEDPDSNYVAGSDQEFYDYHYHHIVHMYNEDNEDKEWQVEGFIVVGLDMYLGTENFYTHLWVNSYPKSFGFTDKAYNGDDVQYDVGLLLGTNLNEHIGVFIEGNKQNFYGKEEYDIKLGFNYKF